MLNEAHDKDGEAGLVRPGLLFSPAATAWTRADACT